MECMDARCDFPTMSPYACQALLRRFKVWFMRRLELYGTVGAWEEENGVSTKTLTLTLKS